MANTFHHRGQRYNKWRNTPRWFTNQIIVRPERQDTRRKLQVLIRGTRDDLEDAPEFGKGNKPNADWHWS